MDSMPFLRRVALYVGGTGLVIAALMTAKFGLSMSPLHAAGLCLLTVAGSIIWPVIKHTWNARSFQTWSMIACGVLFLAVEYFSHLGYTVGTRVGETQQTGVQNTSYQNAQDALASDKKNIDMWREHLAKLQAENAWVASVSADGLKAQVAAADEAVKQEQNRGGCGPRCLRLMKDKGSLEERIALAEQASDLSKKIEATQRLIDTKTQVASATEFKSSPVVNQTNFVAQLWTAELNPDERSLTWTQIVIGAFIAFVTTFLAPIMLNIAFGPERDTPRASRPSQSSLSHAEPVSKTPTVQPTHTREVVVKEVKDSQIWKDIHKAFQNCDRQAIGAA